jgi:hypothetical protein
VKADDNAALTEEDLQLRRIKVGALDWTIFASPPSHSLQPCTLYSDFSPLFMVKSAARSLQWRVCSGDCRRHRRRTGAIRGSTGSARR